VITRRALMLRAIVLGSAALPVSAWTCQAEQTGAPLPSKSGGTLRIGKPEDIIPRGAPHVLPPGNTPLYNLVYNTLVRYDQQFHPQPELATAWEWSADFLQLTLKLRPDVTFHSGRPFTSDDARLNLERLREPSVGSQLRNYAQLMHVASPAPDELVITYDAPARSSFDLLALTYMADPQTVDQVTEGGPFIGTGPFQFQEWAQGDHLTVVSNPAYWQPGRPYLDRVELRVLPDPQAALANLESGAVDWLTGVPGQDARRLQSDPAYQLMLSGSGGTFYYLGFDVNLPALSDRRVRQALGYALNRQRLVDTALYGFGRTASLPWPQPSPAYDATLDQTFTYDPGRARQMLEAISWDTSTVVPLVVPNAVRVSVQMAEMVQADLANIGVRVALQKLDEPEFLARLQKAQMGGAWIITVGFMNLSPATFFTTAFPVRVPNSSNFVSPRYQTLIDQAFASTDEQQLKAVLHELNQILLDESFILVIAENAGQQTGPVVARSSVRDIRWDATGGFPYQDFWLSNS
jgi:peptide/nickel transport system substrate-binding protein